MSPASYSKPWLSYAEQVKLLANRGLIVEHAAAAEKFLRHLNYYRFSGYCLAFETDRHVFVKGTTFEQVVQTYEFDLGLRDLVTEALEVVEVDLRASIAHVFAQARGAFGHVDPSNFFRTFNHSEWIARVREEAERSSELFVKHFKATYSEYPDLPCWVITETISFGSLSKMVSGMNREDQKSIAIRYGVQPHILESWMHHFVYVRNLCAHHSRIWDRSWTIKPELPPGKHWKPPHLSGNSRLFATLLVLRTMMRHMPAVADFSRAWRLRVEEHMKNMPLTKYPLTHMGMPKDWDQHALWV